MTLPASSVRRKAFHARKLSCDTHARSRPANTRLAQPGDEPHKTVEDAATAI
jgi:hypothetical protein